MRKKRMRTTKHMKTMKHAKHAKKLLCCLLTGGLLAGMLPSVAFAEDTGASGTTTNKTIMLGTTGISGTTKATETVDSYAVTSYKPNSYIYFGMKDDTPIKWRVLDKDHANDKTTDGMFLLSEYLLTDENNGIAFQKDYHEEGNNGYKGVAHGEDHSTCAWAYDWQGSDAQSWCRSFASDTGHFSEAEQNVMFGVKKEENGNTRPFGKSWDPCSITAEDHLFFLSAFELSDYVGSYASKGINSVSALTAAYEENGKTARWWLRSPSSSSYTQSGMVDYGGGVSTTNLSNLAAARPACNLNKSEVFFISAATGGKAGTLGTLSEIGAYDGTDWKLTLSDRSRKFVVSGEVTEPKRSGDAVTLSYTGAEVGDNEYLSVFMEDASGTLTHYGRVQEVTSESGEVSITIPSGIADGTYKLHVFNEQYNGDRKTDYASGFSDVTVTVDNTPPVLTQGTATRDRADTALVSFTSDEAGTYYYMVTAHGATVPEKSDILDGAGEACVVGSNEIAVTGLSDAAPKDIHVVSVDAAGNASEIISMNIPIWPVYDMELSETTCDFGMVYTSKYAAPAAQNITVTNKSNVDLTLTQPTAASYTISSLSATTLAPNGTTTFSIQPKSGLSVGTYTETIQITDNSGNVAASVDVTFTVEKQTISVTGATASDRAYEAGNTNVEISGVTFSDSVTLTQGADYTAVGTLTNADAGDQTVSVTVTLTEAAAADYILTGNTCDTTVNIGQIAYNGTTTAEGLARYGGSNTVDLGGLIMSGGTAAVDTDQIADIDSVLAGDPSIDGTALTFAFVEDDAKIGKNATVPVKVTDCTNYTDYTITVTLTVNEKNVPTVTAPAAKTLTYNGADQQLIEAAQTAGGTLQYSTDQQTWTETLPTGKNAGKYTVYYKVVGNEDYADVPAASVPVTIEKKNVIVKPKSYSITQGNEIPTFTLEFEGLANGDSLNMVGAVQFTCTEADGTTPVSVQTAAGTYTITWTNAADFDFTTETNYAVTKETTGTLTISAKPSSSGGSGGYSGGGGASGGAPAPSDKPTDKPDQKPENKPTLDRTELLEMTIRLPLQIISRLPLFSRLMWPWLLNFKLFK